MPRFGAVLRHGRVLASVTHALVTVGLVVGLSATWSGVAAASAAPLHHGHGLGGGPVAAGTVASVPADNAFTITTHAGTTLTVDVTTSTTYVERGVSSPSLADVTQGALVALFGTISGTTVSATEVSIAPPQPSRNFATVGVVQPTPSTTGFTIRTWNGTTVTVDVTASTTYVERGVSSPSLADVTAGESVSVFGTTSGTTVTATEVVIVPPPPPNRDLATAGVVQPTPSTTGFTILTWNGTTVTVDVTASTTYAEYGASSPSLANVTAGDFVAVFGTTSGTTVTATEVVIAGSKGAGLFGFGQPFHFGRGFGGFGGFGFGRGSGHPGRGFGDRGPATGNPGQ